MEPMGTTEEAREEEQGLRARGFVPLFESPGAQNRVSDLTCAGVEVPVGRLVNELGVNRGFWAPDWAFAILEGTWTASEQRIRVLRSAIASQEVRNAILSTWRLGGGSAVARLIDGGFPLKPSTKGGV